MHISNMSFQKPKYVISFQEKHFQESPPRKQQKEALSNL